MPTFAKLLAVIEIARQCAGCSMLEDDLAGK